MYCRTCKAGVLKITKSQATTSGAVKRTRVCSNCKGGVVTYETHGDDALNEYERRLVSKYRLLRNDPRAALWSFLRSLEQSS